MKRMIPVLAAIAMFTAQSALALSISVYQASDTTNIENWLNSQGTSTTVLEDFEGIQTGWYNSLSTGVGDFQAYGGPGQGATSYNANNDPNSDTPYFSIRSSAWYGRGNQTPGGTNYLDSADISLMALDVSGSYTNLFFWLQDPSDVGADTIQGATTSLSTTIDLTSYRQPDGSLWFVGISSDNNDYISNVWWYTATHNNIFTPYYNDGYGLDDFSTRAGNPVPEPSTLILMGAGIVGVALLGRRKKA